MINRRLVARRRIAGESQANRVKSVTVGFYDQIVQVAVISFMMRSRVYWAGWYFSDCGHI